MMRRSDNIVPELCVHDGRGALEFYKQAFGAIEQEHMMNPDGTKLLHGSLTIGRHRFVAGATIMMPVSQSLNAEHFSHGT